MGRSLQLLCGSNVVDITQCEIVKSALKNQIDVPMKMQLSARAV